MEFKKGHPKKKGMYLAWDGAQVIVVKLSSDATANRLSHVMYKAGEWSARRLPDSTLFSPRLRQAAGYSADDRAEQSLADKLRNAQKEIAVLKVKASGMRIIKSPDELVAPKRPVVTLTHAMHAVPGLTGLLEAQGFSWKVDMHEDVRSEFAALWEEKFPAVRAQWSIVLNRFDTDLVQCAWEMYKACKGVS